RGHDNSLYVDVDVINLLDGNPNNGSPFSITLPSFDFSALQKPSIFALLSDPAVMIDGLDRLLLTLQDALNGQIMGAKLPFIGDLLANNPASNFIGDIRADLLQPLANTIRKNNLNLDGLKGL